MELTDSFAKYRENKEYVQRQQNYGDANNVNIIYVWLVDLRNKLDCINSCTY